MDHFVAALGSTPERARVPACPLWDAHDLLAHLVHQLQAANDGTFPVDDAMDALTAPTSAEGSRALERQEAWIETGVEALRLRPKETLVEYWQRLAEGALPQALAALAPDIVVHLFDLLGVKGDRRYRDEPFVAGALRFWAPVAIDRVRSATGMG